MPRAIGGVTGLEGRAAGALTADAGLLVGSVLTAV
jgi:hypothetical protein